jgi:6-phosphogluconolactonase
VEVLPDPEAVAARAAAILSARARAAVADRGRFTLAVSGGRSPAAMFDRLSEEDVPWPSVALYQVDERVAPRGHPDRNLTTLEAHLRAPGVNLRPMPVEDEDLESAAARYADELPPRFDVIHLGLGPDGHTASLVPGDPVLDVVGRDAAVTRPYQGRVRMTLTYPVLDRSGELLWLVTGADKADPVRRLLAGDPSIPAGRVRAARAVLLADPAAAEGG